MLRMDMVTERRNRTMNTADKIKELVQTLNRHRHAYYNLNVPEISDAEYDRLYEQLESLEKEAGIIYSNSPTQTVGYPPVSELEKVPHPHPLLSLDKTKQVDDLCRFCGNHAALLMLKLDGLTVKLTYENGRLAEASTRGDGEIGEDITHNIPAFENVPISIAYKKRLVVTGEAFIHRKDFERLNTTLRDRNGEPYKNARNLAAGSVRSLDSENCKGRGVTFLPFNVLEGLDEGENSNSREERLYQLSKLGFGSCPYIPLNANQISPEYLELRIQDLKEKAETLDLPIDGMVLIFDDLAYSASCGRTGHHYKDGLAYKFEDETYETILRSIEWTPSRFGELAPVAVFDTVEIDGCSVSRATLHNLTFIRELELVPGCRILVSKRNMIIPHVEENLDRGHYLDAAPAICPCCDAPTELHRNKGEKGRIIETVHCSNPSCESQQLKKFVHFVCRKAMNIEGLREATLEKFLNLGYLQTFHDIYHLDQHREEIIRLEGFGEKSFDRLWNAIQASRSTTFVRYLVSMDIPMVGRTKSRVLDTVFSGSLDAFRAAATDDYDFTQLEDFGATLNQNIPGTEKPQRPSKPEGGEPPIVDPPVSGPTPIVDRNGCKVTIVHKTVSIYDANGKLLRQESIVDYTKENVRGEYASLDNFIRQWSAQNKKAAIRDLLRERGIDLEAMKAEQNMVDVDDFDFICHVAFDKKPLTRRERANNVKKRDFLSKYSGAAREVLEALLDKYMNTGIYEIEKTEVLKLDPFMKMGKPAKIASYFGGKEGYLQAVKELEQEIYMDEVG